MFSRSLVAIGCLTLLACQPPDGDPRRGNLTLGAAQMKLESGKTTKAQVLEWFGAPNVATRDKEGEVWDYTRQGTATQLKGSSIGAWFLLGWGGSSSSSARSSSYSFDLLIRFDRTDIVTDYKVLQTAF